MVRDLAGLAAAAAAEKIELRPNPDQPDGAGYYIDDPFGNRIELIDADRADQAGTS